MGVRMKDWREGLGERLGLVENDLQRLVVEVPNADRFDSWVYSDDDIAVLVSFVVILPRSELGAAATDALAEVTDDLFELQVYGERGTSHSSKLLSVIDLGNV